MDEFETKHRAGIEDALINAIDDFEDAMDTRVCTFPLPPSDVIEKAAKAAANVLISYWLEKKDVIGRDV